MPTEKDNQFVQFVVDNTKSGKLRWEITADPTKFVASFKGKYKVTIDRGETHDGEPYHWMTLLDDAERELTQVYGRQNRLVAELFDLARRNSLNVDKAIDEIMGDGLGDDPAKSPGSPVTDEDIPF
jgi:hypothetical protein